MRHMRKVEGFGLTAIGLLACLATAAAGEPSSRVHPAAPAAEAQTYVRPALRPPALAQDGSDASRFAGADGAVVSINLADLRRFRN